MHVGMSTVFQNPNREKTDFQVYRDELRLADLAEPLGYQSIWGVEHHFTDYTMCPDVIQFLTYMAGRTQDALLGTIQGQPGHARVKEFEAQVAAGVHAAGKQMASDVIVAAVAARLFLDGATAFLQASKRA